MGFVVFQIPTHDLTFCSSSNLCYFRFGSTPLHQAAYFGHFDCAAVLLAAGALANVEEAWGQTPLFLAAQRAHRFVVIVIVIVIILF